jgi:hypothetical protein
VRNLQKQTLYVHRLLGLEALLVGRDPPESQVPRSDDLLASSAGDVEFSMSGTLCDTSPRAEKASVYKSCG